MNGYIIFKDITQVERLEAQKRQAHKMQAIGTLAGGIAHEFNNSLTTMLGFSELNLRLLPPDSRKWQYTQEVIAAGKRARDLVEDILAFSHPKRQDRAPVALAPLVRDAVRLLQATMPATVEVRQELAADVGEVMINPRNIHQVIMNLGANAEHAMRASGGVLTVCLDAIEVDVPFASEHSELSPGAYCRLTVEDTGHGMTSDIVSHIFEPFFTMKDIGDGTGMGLAIIHGLVVSVKGEIVVESVPGQGTSFMVYIPQSDKASV